VSVHFLNLNLHCQMEMLENPIWQADGGESMFINQAYD